MQVNCSICGEAARDRPITTRSRTARTLWHCAPCDYDFFAHDPTPDIALDKLDESRLKAAGLDIPTRERDFANGTAQSRALVAEYIDAADRGANVLEVGCSWGYFLNLVREAGAHPHGVELNAVRAAYVSDELGFPCDVGLAACEARGVRFRKIFLFYVLEHMTDPVADLRRLIGLLEDGGQLIVVTPNLSDALKDLWRNEGFSRFFYDEHSIHYLSMRAVERLVARLPGRDAAVTTRQGYSFINHVSWFLSNAPRTTGVVGGDNFVRDAQASLAFEAATAGPAPGQGSHVVASRLSDLIGRFDAEYRRVLEEHRYGNQVRFVIRK